MQYDATRAGNLSDLVRQAARRRGDHPALLFRDQRVTWTELDRDVDAVAAVLRHRHEPGDRVAIALGNVPDFARVYFGALRAGLVAVPVNPSYRAGELRHILSDSGASILVGTASVAAEVAPLRAELPELREVYTPHGEEDSSPLRELISDDPAPEAAIGGGDDLAVLLYTSGTEGQPKGAMLSHRAFHTNLEQLDDMQPRVLGATDVMLLALPLFHSYGLGPGLHAIARHGATGVLVERFDPAETLALIQRHHVSVVLGVPQMYAAWSRLEELEEAFASVRLAVSGAAPLDVTAQRAFRERTRQRVFEGYGLTEAAPVVTSTLMSPVSKPGSIGRPLPGVELKLVGLDGQQINPQEHEDDEDTTPGTDPGEIWVRGGNLFSGYWPDGRDGPDADGWWATRDLAYADGDGDLFLVDRLRELVLVSGFNVYPREVEQVLDKHPDVREAAVIGVPHPETGETVKAFVVPEPGRAPTADDLASYCAQHLARFKCPTSIEFVDELPHSVTGKVRKSLLRDLASEGA